TAGSNSLGSGALTVTGGTLNIGAAPQSVNGMQVTGGTITATSPVAVITNTGSTFDMQGGTVNAVLGGAANLTKSGTAGTTILSSANTYTGTTTVSSGILQVGVLANGGAASSVGASGNAAANLVLDGRTLTFNSSVVGVQTSDRLFTLNQNSTLLNNSSNAGTVLYFNNSAG